MILSSAVILAEIHDSITIYYYFNFKDSKATGASSFLKSILRQLIEQCKFSGDLLEHESELRKVQHLQSVDQLVDTFLIIAPLMRQHIYLVIDAVDESMDEDLIFESVGRMIVNCQCLSLLFTTRHHFVVSDNSESTMPRRVCISEQKESQDIKIYISSRLQTDKRMAKWPTELKEEVLQTLNQDAAGM